MSAAAARPVWPPIHWPARGVRPAGEPLVKAAIVFTLLSLTVLDRFGLRVLGDWALPPPILAMYLLAGALLFTGAAELNRRALLCFVAIVATAALSFLVNTWFEPRPHQSLTAWLLVMLSYAPFVVSLGAQADARLWRWTLRLYVVFALLVAAAGILQFLAQFVVRPAWLFDYTALIPQPIRGAEGWRTVHPVADWVQSDGYWMKSNGFFLREPSIFSLAMALGMVCELALGARRWVLAALAGALVLSYSGSGVLCLAVALVFPLGAKTALRVLGLALAATVLVLVFGDALNLSYTLHRAAEFGSENSSAYCRFVHPWLSVLRQLEADAWSALIGHGPGSMTRAGASCADLHEPTYGKLLFEYGLVGALAFGTFIVQALNRAAAPLRVRVALGVSWLLLGGHLVNSELLPTIYLISAMWPAGAAEREA